MTETELARVANEVRKGILVGTHAAKSGHPGGSLGAADILTYLYFEEMSVRPDEPRWEGRDRFVLSKGHCAPALYATLAERGFFPKGDLETLRHIGSHLQGHPNMNDTPGVDMSTGSLGQGVSAAAGMALAAKHWGDDWRVFALLGDGEVEEGMVWEAAMFAGNHALDNLVVIVDHNGLQIDGTIEEVNSAMPIADKFRVPRLQVPRHRARGRQRHVPGARRLRGGPRGHGAAGVHRRRDRQGQGRLVHGGPGGLARQGAQRRRVRPGHGRARGRGKGALAWQT